MTDTNNTTTIANVPTEVFKGYKVSDFNSKHYDRKGLSQGITFKVEIVNSDDVVYTKNDRLARNEGLDGILNNRFNEKGFMIPLLAYRQGDKYPLVEGRRRLKVCQYLKVNDPAKWETHCKKIPVIVVGNYTQQDLLLLKTNYEESQSLGTKVEFTTAAVELFRAGFTEKQVVAQLWNIYKRLYMDSISKDGLEKVAQYVTAIASAKTIEEELKATSIITSVTHGAMQQVIRFVNCPPFVLDSWRAIEDNRQIEYPADVDWIPADMQSAKPKTSSTELMRVLEKAVREDWKITENGKSVFDGQQLIGPAFREAWLQACKEALAPQTARGTGLSVKKLTEKLSSAKSAGLTGIKAAIEGKGEADFAQVDAMVNTMEYLRDSGITLAEFITFHGEDKEKPLVGLLCDCAERIRKDKARQALQATQA